jgi:hypothetical protein
MSFDVGLAMVWGVVALSIYSLVSELRGALRAFDSTRWPATSATVIESGWKIGGAGGLFVPVVRYRYAVDGREFRGDRIAFWGFLGRGGFSESSAQDWSNRWLPEQPTTVHYHPKHSEIAVLAPGLNWRVGASLLVAVVAGGIFLTGALILIFV